jgi:hypothetical protein
LRQKKDYLVIKTMVFNCFVLQNVPERFVLKPNAPNAQRHFVLDYLIRMTHGAMTIIPADFCYEDFSQMMYLTIFARTNMA